jgi:hypothetical protein
VRRLGLSYLDGSGFTGGLGFGLFESDFTGLGTAGEIGEDRTRSGSIGAVGFSQGHTRDDQSRSASRDTLFRVLYSGFWGAWMLGLAVTQALAGAIDRGDPMGVQGMLGKPGMERG